MSATAQVCDKKACPAPATHICVLGEQELVFCTHHTQEVSGGLEKAGFKISALLANGAAAPSERVTVTAAK